MRGVRTSFREAVINSSGVRGLKVSTGTASSRPVVGGRITSTGTNGKRNLSSKELKSLRSQTLVSLAKKTGIFELIWYPTFILGGLLCLFLLPIDFQLILCVAQLFLCMTANNLAARGKRIGLLISTVSMAMYVYVSAVNGVWGEVIINTCMYIPLEIIGFFRWKKAIECNSSNILTINKFGVKEYLTYGGMIVGASLGIFLVLHFGLKQNFAIFNAIAIATGVVGNFTRNKRFIETWFIYVVCNLAGIALWGCEAFMGGGEITLSVLPLMLSYTSTLTNDFNGWALWEIMFKKQNATDSVFLAKRKVNIKKVAKLKTTYRKFTCQETSDVSGEKFRSTR